MLIWGAIFSWTWWLWCPAFIFCLVSAIRRSVQQTTAGEGNFALHFTLLAAILFTLIIGGLVEMICMYAA